jgi:hypothetical protein
MTVSKHRPLSRRAFVGGAMAAGALRFAPAGAQEQPPVIEPIDPEESVEETPVEQGPTEEPIAPQADPPAQIEQIIEQEGGEYFAETGHNVLDPFLAPWRTTGGVDALGMPLSESRFNPESGRSEQYFEGIVLTRDPEAEGDWAVQGAFLPESVIAEAVAGNASARQAVAGCGAGDASCLFFPDTGHTISGEIAAFWTAGGGLPVFGLPLTEAFRDGESTRQVFERVILEGRDGEVAAAAIGAELRDERGLDGDAAFLPAPPMLGTSTFVAASDGLRLREAPSTDAEVIAVLPENVEFIAVTGATGEWIPGYADGYSGYVAAEFLTNAPREVPTAAVGGQWDASVWQGVALNETNIRSQTGTSGRIVRTIQYGDQVTVVDWIKGEKVDGGSDTWAVLDDGSFVYERNLGRSGPVEATPVPDDAPWEGKWIDCNLTQQLLVAYEGRTPVRVAVQTTGKPGWETPVGYYAINNRVANETMESGSIGADEFYKLENVLYTQYFTDRGHALHFAWWKTPETIGRPGSHGCLNLLLDDAEFFWNWAGIGVPVYCHY